MCATEFFFLLNYTSEDFFLAENETQFVLKLAFGLSGDFRGVSEQVTLRRRLQLHLELLAERGRRVHVHRVH